MQLFSDERRQINVKSVEALSIFKICRRGGFSWLKGSNYQHFIASACLCTEKANALEGSHFQESQLFIIYPNNFSGTQTYDVR